MMPIGKRFAETCEWSGMSDGKRRKSNLIDDSGIKMAKKRITSDKLTPLDQQVKDLKEANMDKLLVVEWATNRNEFRAGCYYCQSSATDQTYSG